MENWKKLRKELYDINADRLTKYAVELRYPGDFLFPALKEAIKIAEQIKNFTLKKLKERNFSI